MKRFVLPGAVLMLAVGAVGPVRGDFAVSGDFQGLSDTGALLLPNSVPVSPLPIEGGFVYTDNGTVTTVSVYFGQPGLLPPVSHYNFDTFSDATLGMPDADRAIFPGNPIDAMFKIGADGTLTLDFTNFGVDRFFFLEREVPSLGFFGFGGVNIAFRLTGTLHLLADGSVDPLSVSLYGFAGGDYAYIGGPLTEVVPEPSSLTLLGIGTLGLLGYGWRRRKRAV